MRAMQSVAPCESEMFIKSFSETNFPTNNLYMKKPLNLSLLPGNIKQTVLLGTFAMLTALPTQAQKVTLGKHVQTVKAAMEAIEKQTGYKFFFNNSQVNTARNVNVKADSKALKTVLNELFAGSDVSYELVDKTIVLSTGKQKDQKTQQPEATKHKVMGTVIDAKGEPIVGATVKIKGTSTGTLSDLDGNFTIEASSNNTLQISYIGFASQELAVGNRHALKITMAEDDNVLNEVIVIGYGSVRKADLAGSVSVMSDKAFKDQPIKDVSEAFQGRMTGINVVQSGVPGGSVKIRVRGTSSIHRNNDPLYVVDGIVRESGLDGINSEDIQSIQVLKDASSTAIYGSRGSNGVVLVQTKQGKKGQQAITFDASMGFANAYHMPKVMGTKEYAQALLDANRVTNKAELQPYLDGTKPGIDWMDEILRTGTVQNYKLVISKGNADTQYYISGSYLKNKGVVESTQYERYQAKLNVHSTLYKWFEVTGDLDYSHGKSLGGGFTMAQDNPLWIAQNYSPTMEMKDASGKYNLDPYNSIQHNPYGMLTANASQYRTDIINGRIDLKFNILPGLTFTSTNGFDYFDGKGYSFSTARVFPQSSMGNNDSQRMMLQSTNNLTYMGNWGKHSLTATGVFEASQSTTRMMGLSGKNLQSESVGWWDYNNASSRSGSNGYSKWGLLSAVGRVMYNYDDRYMLTGTMRADGSSRFSKKKWGYFPSIAAAWTVSREKFMQSVTWISNMKVRASYGLIGNQGVPEYATLGNMSMTSYDFGTSTNYTGYWAANIATPELTWEKSKQFDLGLDISFFKNRLELSFDYFNKKTTDALLHKSQANYLGGSKYWINAGEISNKGFDIALTAHVLESSNFSWTTTLNGSYLKNKVEKLTSEDPVLYGNSPSPGTVEPSTIVKEGESIGTFYGYKWAGLNADGLDSYYTKDGSITTKPQSDDRQVLGCANPDFTLGWNNTVNYKNWEFNAFFNSAFGAQRLNLVRFAMNSMVGASKFVTDANYLKEIGKTMPALNAVGNNNLGNSSKWIENANYLRCENISIAYNIARKYTRFADIRVSLSAQNLFTLTGYKGADPSGMSFAAGNVDMDNGINMGTYPNPRTFTFDIRFNF